MEKVIVYIKSISWVDKDSSEAEVLFEICERQFWAFCHPCDFSEGEIAEVYFSFIEEEISETAFWNENKEQKIEIIPSENNRWRYYCYGRLKNIHPVIVDCETFDLSFGNWINDERVIGSYVYFVISRLNIGRIKE